MERYPSGAQTASESSVDGSTEATGPWLAIDYGKKRVGLAISDADLTLAIPFKTLQRRSDGDLINQIKGFVSREGIVEFVLGEPRRLDGSIGEAAQRARRFGKALTRATGLRCTLVDEALTSRAAEERLRNAGVDLTKHRERIDQVAAQILLEERIEQWRLSRRSPT